MIKAILFDIDGVLLDSFEANYRYMSGFFETAGYAPPTKDEFKRLFPLNFFDAVREFLHLDLLDVAHLRVLREEQLRKYDHSLVMIPEGLVETLDVLATRYVLGLVTGRLRDAVFVDARLQGLSGRFTTVVSYEDTDKHKPSPDPLLLACERLGLHPSDSIYIGDAESDMLAANAAGMKAIRFAAPQVSSTDVQTSDFRRLPELIASLDR